jgi:hypothetical protein
MLYLCEDVGVASYSSHILCSYNLSLGSISSVNPDSVNGQDFLLIVSSSSFRPIPSSFVASLHSGMILDNKVPTPSHQLKWPTLQNRDPLKSVVTEDGCSAGLPAQNSSTPLATSASLNPFKYNMSGV